jgi:hypothetical protein
VRHDELTARCKRPAGWAPSECQGDLEFRRFVRGDGEFNIFIGICLLCGNTLSVEIHSDDILILRNDWAKKTLTPRTTIDYN